MEKKILFILEEKCFLLAHQQVITLITRYIKVIHVKAYYRQKGRKRERLSMWMSHQRQIREPRLLLNLSAASREISIGSGLEGDVFKDKNNPGFVIKRYHTSDDAGEECELFNRFYGEGSAEVFVENGKTHLRMLEVPGTPLKKLSEFPKDSEKLFLNMIIDMAEHKIIHGDLHMENILYDESAHRFWPIDFSNSYERYYSLDGDKKPFANELSESDFSSVLTALRNRIG